jgi:hypothetical protein
VLCDLEKLIQQMVQMDAGKRPESVTVVKEELQSIAQRWSTQHRRGLQAQGLPGLQPPDAVMGTRTAVSTAAGAMSMGKMAQLSGAAPGMGSSSSAYWGPTTQKRGNPMAVASVSLAILSIALPLFSCVGTSFLDYYFGIGSFSPAFFLPVLVTLVPSILAVIFGHIGKRRAMTVPGLSGTKDIAAAGMAIGYIFGLIYLVFCFLILLYFL